jgi:hypothetical protein
VRDRETVAQAFRRQKLKVYVKNITACPRKITLIYFFNAFNLAMDDLISIKIFGFSCHACVSRSTATSTLSLRHDIYAVLKEFK